MALLKSFPKHLVILAAFPLLTLVSTKPIKSASCVILKSLASLCFSTLPIFLTFHIYKDLHVALFLFLHSPPPSDFDRLARTASFLREEVKGLSDSRKSSFVLYRVKRNDIDKIIA